MSLEQALIENTAAVLELAVALRANSAVNRPATTDTPDVKDTVKVAAAKKPAAKAAESAAPASTPASGTSTQDAAAASTAASETAAAGSSAEQASSTFDYAILQRAVTDLVATDRAAAIAILAKYGVKNATGLTEEQREPCYKEFLAALSGEESLA